MRDDGRSTGRGERRRRGTWVAAVAVLVALVGSFVAQRTPRAGDDRPAVLASYYYSGMPATHLDALAAHGFNTALIKYSIEAWDDSLLADLRLKAVRGDSLGIAVLPVVNAHNRRVLAAVATDGREFRDAGGRRYAGVPSPADTAYWSAWWEAMVVPAARVAGGVAIDLELYDAGDLHHWPAGPCTHRESILEFTGYGEGQRDLAAAWIDRLGERDLEDLASWQRQLVAACFTRRLGRLQADGIRLAVLDLGRVGLVTRALAVALERLAMPVVDLTELTYDHGSRVSDRELTGTYGDLDLEVTLVPGYWLYRWRPDELGRDIVEAGRRHDGFWIFTSYSLHVRPDRLEGAYRLQGDQEAYWQALATATAALGAGAEQR